MFELRSFHCNSYCWIEYLCIFLFIEFMLMFFMFQTFSMATHEIRLKCVYVCARVLLYCPLIHCSTRVRRAFMKAKLNNVLSLWWVGLQVLWKIVRTCYERFIHTQLHPNNLMACVKVRMKWIFSRAIQKSDALRCVTMRAVLICSLILSQAVCTNIRTNTGKIWMVFVCVWRVSSRVYLAVRMMMMMMNLYMHDTIIRQEMTHEFSVRRAGLWIKYTHTVKRSRDT